MSNTCQRTYASLRIQHPTESCEDLSKVLGIPASNAGERCWVFSTECSTNPELDDHLFLILKALENKERQIKELQEDGYQIDIFSYWLSKNGHGGPDIKPATMLGLGKLDIQLGIDFYTK